MDELNQYQATIHNLRAKLAKSEAENERLRRQLSEYQAKDVVDGKTKA